MTLRDNHLYDKEEAAKFASFVKESFSWKYIERPAFDQQLEGMLDSNCRVLDVGCGEGRLIEYMTSKGVGEENITGFDNSEEMLNLARKRFPGAEFKNIDFTRPLEAVSKYDVIVSHMVLHHFDLDGLSVALENFYKLLSDQGKLIYIVPHPVRLAMRDLSSYLEENSQKTERTPWGTDMIYFHKTVSNYVNVTINNGLKIVFMGEPRLPNESEYEVEYSKYANGPTRLVIAAKKDL